MSRRVKLAIVVITIFVGLGTMYVVSRTSTLSDFIGIAKKSSTLSMAGISLSYRLTEFGELFVNLPTSKTPHAIRAIVPWIGLVLFLLTVLGLSTKRRRIGTTEVFLVCYMGILFVWPYYDARFWLPVIPLLIAYLVLAVKRLRLPHAVVLIYCGIFAALGVAAIAYSTVISFSGSRFPDRYGDGTLRSTYCAAFDSCKSIDYTQVNVKALRLLREYK
jgi:hypothetical protein